MEVCSTITEFGGRAFKKALIKYMIANEDKELMDEVAQEHLKDQGKINTRTNDTGIADLHVYLADQKN